MIKKTILVLFIFISTLNTRADEGMWLLSLLNQMNIGEMQAQGFQLTSDDIYSVNKASMKDAVCGFGSIGNPFQFSCTSELISPNGLLLTNHHCGYDEIQAHSTMENNYVGDGFWAPTLKDELQNPEKTASFLIRMEDVTSKVLAKVTDAMNESERGQIIADNISEIEQNAVSGSQYGAKVSDFFKGNKYYLMVYITYSDVRLVGAPPSSIGKFGGDTDNWMWPRHTGDFSMFRIYTAPNGDPAEYSEENVPLKSKHFFPISIKGVNKNDFAMVMGYPGGTDRYMSSWGVKQTMETTNQARIDIRTPKLNIMREDMDSDPEIFMKYTSKYNASSNYWKYSIGQNKGLRRLKVVDKKKNIEKELDEWISSDPIRKEKYGEALDLIHNSIIKNKDSYYVQQYLMEALLEGPEIVMMAYHLAVYNQMARSPEEAEIALENLKSEAEKHFKDYNQATDEKLMAELFEVYAQKVDKDNHPAFFKSIEEDFQGNYKAFAKYTFLNSIVTSKEKLYNFVEMEDMSHIVNSSKAIMFAAGAKPLIQMIEADKFSEEIKAEIEEVANKLFAEVNVDEDIEEIVKQLNYTIKNVEKSKRPDIFATIDKDFGGNYEKFASTLMKKSIFANAKKMKKFLKKPTVATIENDLAYQLATSISGNIKEEILSNDMGLQIVSGVLQMYFGLMNIDNDDLNKGERLFVAALMEKEKDKKLYPDANSTIRLTYGKVGDYKAADAVRYKHYTTLRGIMEKEDPDSHEFQVPQKLKDLYAKKDYGEYGENGELRVCFTTNNDITGGNSGSPVINGNGELIGVAFDGNWEAMSGDIAFEHQLQKCINVDIRYVLFIIDKYAGAQRLIDEMSIVK